MRNALAVLAALSLGVLLAGCGHSAAPPAGFPKTIVVHGQTETFAGTETFFNPVAGESDPALLYVYGSSSGPAHTCGSTPVAHVQAQTASAVTVLVAQYAVRVKGNIACASSAGVVRLTVRLTRPLGRRTLLDAGDGGVARPVLDPATIPSVRRLPAGYLADPVGVVPDGTEYGNRGYHGPHGDLVLSAKVLNSVVGPTRRTTTVQGHPAEVGWSKGFEQDISVTWNVGHRQIELYQTSNYDHGQPALTADQLIAVARSVR